MRNTYYLAEDGKTPIEAESLEEWREKFRYDDGSRNVARHVKENGEWRGASGPFDTGDGEFVSTVFLGINHNFFPGGRPVLWETMIFGGPNDGYQERYSSHERAVKRAMAPSKLED